MLAVTNDADSITPDEQTHKGNTAGQRRSADWFAGFYGTSAIR